MSDERKGGLALIFANVAGVLTMALHPVPHQMGDPHVRILNVAVHALAMLAAPVALVGGIALARRTGSLSAVVFQAFALVAAVLATAMSGLEPRPSRASDDVAVTSSGCRSGPSGSRKGTLRWTGPGRGSPRAAA